MTLHQIGRRRWKSAGLVPGAAAFHQKIPALNVAGLAQTPPEAGQAEWVGFWRSEVELTDHWDFRLLRARPQWPRSRTADRGYQFPPSDNDRHIPPSLRGPGNDTTPRACGPSRREGETARPGCRSAPSGLHSGI